ncbi:MAG: hypothetical protein CSYNP_01873 [Syntrophus sp. SKADARSKE-3]|nr:hypothetical protein [Syntrophus sp. SKADARSKE-3]
MDAELIKAYRLFLKDSIRKIIDFLKPIKTKEWLLLRFKSLTRKKQNELVQAYSFTSKEIAAAIVKAKQEGFILKSPWTNQIVQPNTVRVILQLIWVFQPSLMLNMPLLITRS